MSSLDEFKMLSDLSNFKNLAAMMEAEAFMRSKKRKKRRNKKRSREFEAPLRRNVCILELFLFEFLTILLSEKNQDKREKK